MQQLYDTLQLEKINTKTITGEEQLIGCVRTMKWPSNYYELCYTLTIKKCITFSLLNVLNEKSCTKIGQKNFYRKKSFYINTLYAGKLFLWEFWQNFKNHTSYTRKLCIWETM